MNSYSESYEEARELHERGYIAYDRGDYVMARSLHEQALSLSRVVGHKSGIAQSLYDLGLVAEAEDTIPAALSLYEESLAIWRELQDKEGIARSLIAVGVLNARNMDYADAQYALEESLALKRELKDRQGTTLVLSNLANVLKQRGHRADARALRMEALALQRELGDELGIVWSLEMFAKMAMPHSEYGVEGDIAAERAARLWGATEALHNRVRFPSSMLEKEQQRFEGGILEYRRRLDRAGLRSIWEEGAARQQSMPLIMPCNRPSIIRELYI